MDKNNQQNDERVDSAPQVGGITSKDTEINVPHSVFDTKGSEPVRDKTADPSKGTPVTRYFTKDGTPVEPSTVPPAETPSNLKGFDPSKRDDLVTAVEYLDEAGSVVTHDMLKKSNKSK